LVKKIKPNFKTLGPRYGKIMKQLAGIIMKLDQADIRKLENGEALQLEVNGQPVEITRDDVEIFTQDIPGWSVATLDNLTVALDITLTDELKKEGLARELVNRIQNMRKEKGLEVTDRILLQIEKSDATYEAIQSFKDYICTETLADLSLVENPQNNGFEEVELIDGIPAKIKMEKKQ
jgi:isoleucyl-tRNA synthetase